MTILIETNVATGKNIAKTGGYEIYKGKAQPDDIIIRWGANRNREPYPKNTKVLNPKLMVNKKLQYAAFTHNNIPHPMVYHTRKQWIDDGKPQLLIKPEVGQSGDGIALIDRPNWGLGHQENGYLYQLYIPKEREFRAMMVGNIMAFFMEKFPGEDKIRWNEHKGATWTNVEKNRILRKKVKTICYNALQAIHYDFGAVDVMMDNKGQLYVLEVNSRPQFGGRNVQRFVNAIQIYLGG